MIRTKRRLAQLVVLLLSGAFVLAGCQNQGSSSNAERQDGFYGGVTGGLSRP